MAYPYSATETEDNGASFSSYTTTNIANYTIHKFETGKKLSSIAQCFERSVEFEYIVFIMLIMLSLLTFARFSVDVVGSI